MNHNAYRIRLARKYSGLSAVNAAAALGIHFTELKKMEAGIGGLPNPETLAAMSRIYKTGITWLTGEYPEKVSADDCGFNPEQVARMDEETRERMLILVAMERSLYLI